MEGFAHTSVLASEVVELLAPRDGGVYCDGTLGGGGHAFAVLEASAPSGRLYGIDRDPSALAAASARLAPFAGRFVTIHGEFADVEAHLAAAGIDQVDGLLLDLGVSSPQLDHAARGFSFMHEGPLDMRMDPSQGPTALEFLRAQDDASLTGILRDYGEERHAKRIARLILEAVRAERIHTTTELAAVVASGIPAYERAKSKIHPATRSFQGIRIALNRELEQLERFLAAFPRLLRVGGRCVIISFHSLEDRLVKHCFRDLEWTSSLPARYADEAGERTVAVCERITRKAVFADDAETDDNPRARSARVRACQRTAAPITPKLRLSPSRPS